MAAGLDSSFSLLVVGPRFSYLEDYVFSRNFADSLNHDQDNTP
jgi:hypothetical protein